MDLWAIRFPVSKLNSNYNGESRLLPDTLQRLQLSLVGLSMDSSSYLVVSTQWFQTQAPDGRPQILPFQEEGQAKQPDLDLQAKKLLIAQQVTIFLKQGFHFSILSHLSKTKGWTLNTKDKYTHKPSSQKP